MIFLLLIKILVLNLNDFNQVIINKLFEPKLCFYQESNRISLINPRTQLASLKRIIKYLN